MGSISQQLNGIDLENLPDVTERAKSAPEPKAQQSETRGFNPVSGPETTSGVEPVDSEALFSFGESKFNELINARKEAGKVDETPTLSEQPNNVEVKEALPPEMVEISAIMYVQILESVWGAVCEWFSGVSGNYDFEKKMKERYEKVTAMYFEVQNVQLTPSHFFALMTVFVLFGSGFRAYKDRKKRITAESFAKKSRSINNEKAAGTQTVLFDAEPVTRQRQYFAMEGEYYTKDPISGAYAKKDDREKVPAELLSFLPDFKEKHGRWPVAKEVETFLKQA